MKSYKITLILLTAILGGCASVQRYYSKQFNNEEGAPVVSFDDAPTVAGVHVVQPGETLYSIAWRYGRDYKDLAAINRISAPYKINAGQSISLSGGGVPMRARASAPERSSNSAWTEVDNVPKQSSHDTPTAKSFDQKPIKAPESAKPLKNEPEVSKNVGLDRASIDAPKASDEAGLVLRSSESAAGWEWPVKGKIISSYAQHPSKTNKGIDIGGSLGSAVKAARSGKVVYSGTGLRGYGQLLIIKHNETYLSAYAHNSRLLVKEGDNVQKGQVISEMGQTDTHEVKLHFEIRKNGQPINPVTLLPA